MKTSEQIDQISKAMSTAQGEMNPASKSSVNPFYKSTYSSLTQVWEAIREPLTRNGLSVLQDVVSTVTGVAVSTRICHLSGQWMEFGPLEIIPAKKDAQAMGSATSYAKRYALSAALGVVSGEDDDDGEKAMDRKKKVECELDDYVITKEQIQNIKELVPQEKEEGFLKYLKSIGYETVESIKRKDYDKLIKMIQASVKS